ncbi:small subunit processome component 20 isoform X2 [Salvia divinorum]|uniref:Small subunit processome component 20 isoform X2 n=1 Tax=Salvia divinorum TaxID=28513 RepID=A0ABD1G3V8_SALDI
MKSCLLDRERQRKEVSIKREIGRVKLDSRFVSFNGRLHWLKMDSLEVFYINLNNIFLGSINSPRYYKRCVASLFTSLGGIYFAESPSLLVGDGISVWKMTVRARALARFSNFVSSVYLSKAITYKVFVPLLFSMLFNARDGKDESIRSACVNALGSISGCMTWDPYIALLVRLFRYLSQNPTIRNPSPKFSFLRCHGKESR